MNRILLLDIDGVLIRPGGYRAALRATVHHFIDPDFEMREDDLTGLEMRGITSEWDMSPLLIASYWDFILARQPMPNLPPEVPSAAREIQSRRRVDVPKRLPVPAFELVAGQYPAESAFRAGCFPAIPYELRKNLLTGTRSVHKSHTMRIFQHYTLGSQNFTDTYHLEAEIETESFLLKHDQPNLDDSVRAALRRDGNRIAAFTARPSRPPRETTGSALGYAPEAELALELVGLQGIPLVAFGKLEYIAAQYQLDPEVLLKPSPFHALAATLAAWRGEELSALQAAYEWRNTGALTGRFSALPASFELVVIEDTLGGIRSAQAAGKILRAAGFDVAVRALGLTSGNAAKAQAFDRAGVQHYADWQALVEGMGL